MQRQLFFLNWQLKNYQNTNVKSLQYVMIVV